MTSRTFPASPACSPTRPGPGYSGPSSTARRARPESSLTPRIFRRSRRARILPSSSKADCSNPRRKGRHRYFRIASAEVAGVIESMASLSAATRPRAPRAPLPSRSVPVQFLHARTCYGHLAGEMAVRILEAMLKARWLTADGRDFAVTRLGEAKLAALDVDLAAARQPRRAFARACVDLTQRRPHLGGALGDVLLNLYVARGWVQRQRRSRVVSITPKGHENFRRVFGT